MTDELIAYIGVRGPITVAEFMRRVLRDGRYGYYTSKGSRSGQKDGGMSLQLLMIMMMIGIWMMIVSKIIVT